ncbi:epidermal growth factor receptor kinase substrate 8-like protein 3b [Brachyistius frenatus]|uniref:epidermal growth factor receptor kinase substrate 8-like protein 3b n=1 Tax=Brachyistius frenatus TaxID=100188 RepID=UPI0037E71111
MFGNTSHFSYSPRGFSPEDLPQQRQAFQQNDLKDSSLRKSMSRPSGRSIYMQRREYSEGLNRQPDNFNFRVEHLFTGELDGQDMKTVNDCVVKLKSLDAKGRLWPQEMIMEVQGVHLLLSDIETKAELESIPLSCIVQTKAVLDSCVYNSVLTLTVQERSRRVPQVFMFQCEETRAQLIKSDLDKAIRTGGDSDPRRELSDIRINLENIIGQHTSGNFQQVRPHPVQQGRGQPLLPPAPNPLATQWSNREPDYMPLPRLHASQEETMRHPDFHESQRGPEKTESDRNTDILNHVINDLEIFMNKVMAVVNISSQKEDKKKKKNAYMKMKSKKNGKYQPPLALKIPPWQEYLSFLQKIKYGLNLLGQLDGILTQPSAPDFVHIFFTVLGTIIPHYSAELPPKVLSPLLTETAVRLLSQVLSLEEDGLWNSLGDSWNIPRSRWPDDDVPPYIPDFYDGWQPPAPPRVSSPPPYQNGALSRSNSQRFPPGQPSVTCGQRSMEFSTTNTTTVSINTQHSSEPAQYMRVIYDFLARNNRELSIMKGEVVQVIQKSKQWWLVRNTHDQEGNVPQNVLEPMRSGGPMEDRPRDTRGPVTLDMASPPAEVKAWFEYKGFSKITVRTLGVLSGQLLLGMSKDEIRTVCPEEGGKVFFQLQAVKSAIALASEPYDSLY